MSKLSKVSWHLKAMPPLWMTLRNAQRSRPSPCRCSTYAPARRDKGNPSRGITADAAKALSGGQKPRRRKAGGAAGAILPRIYRWGNSGRWQVVGQFEILLSAHGCRSHGWAHFSRAVIPEEMIFLKLKRFSGMRPKAKRPLYGDAGAGASYRERDSNPRYLAVLPLIRRLPSASQPPLHKEALIWGGATRLSRCPQVRITQELCTVRCGRFRPGKANSTGNTS